MGADSFIIHIKTEEIYNEIENDVEKILDTSNCEVNRPLSKGKNNKK